MKAQAAGFAPGSTRVHTQPLWQPKSPALPLSQGLRLLKTTEGLVGWQVVATDGPKRTTLLGTIDKVETIQVDGGSSDYQLVRVVQPAVLQPYGYEGKEVHHLPLVPEIITAVYPQHKLVTAKPPAGLLDLGRRGLLLSFLSQELLPYAATAKGRQAAPPNLLAGAQVLTQPREMPTRGTLLAADRSDLVGLITKAGGFAQVALQLGLQAARRPMGYWDSLEMLDMELDAFIAGCWVALPCFDDDFETTQDSDTHGTLLHEQQSFHQATQPGADEYYLYNTATHSLCWTLPEEVQQLLVPAATSSHQSKDKHQGTLSPEVQQCLLTLQEERVMPSHGSIVGAGRWDLKQAIDRHGGYRAVAEALDRRSCRALPKAFLHAAGLRDALQQESLQHGWDVGAMPTRQQLADLGRNDLIRAIQRLGGWRRAASSLGLRNRYKTSPAWQAWSLQEAAVELSQFMQNHPPPEPQVATHAATQSLHTPDSRHATITAPGRLNSAKQQQSVDANSPTSVDRREGKRSGTRAGQQMPGQERPSSWRHLPTHAQLMAAGRHDLVYSLRRYSPAAVEAQLGLEPKYRRPKTRNRLQWANIRAALLAGCSSCKEILAFVSSQQQPQQDPGLVSPSKAPLEPTLVTKGHLSYMLSIWTAEGRLIKTGTTRFRYHLASDE